MTARLVVAGPNLTIDRTASIARLAPGDVLRTREVAVSAGGKGVNVVRFAAALGAEAELVGFLPGRLGQAAAGMLADAGVALHAVPTAGELRSTAILREDDGRVTVLNEPGPPVTAEDWDAYEAAVADLLARPAVLVCSGSVPPGAPEDAYARLVGRARERGLPVVVDAGGALLAAAVREAPDAVTPNLAEAEGVVGRGDGGEPETGGDGAEVGTAGEGVEVDGATAPGRARRAAARLVAMGARVAVVTASAAGAAVATGGAADWLPAPAVTAHNPIGAGDALTAGFAVALAEGADPVTAAARGIGAGAASVEEWLPGRLDPERARALAPERGERREGARHTVTGALPDS